MKNSIIRKIILSTSGIAIIAALPACTSVSAQNTPRGNGDMMTSRGSVVQPLSREGMERTVRDDGYRVDASLAKFGQRDSVRAAGTQVSNGIFLGAKAQRLAASASLPSQFEGPNAVSLVSKSPMSLPDIAARLSESTGIHHVVSLGATGVQSNGVTGQSNILEVGPMQDRANVTDDNGNPIANKAPTPSGSNYIGASAEVGGEGSSEVLARTMIPQLRGPLSRVLDEIASTFGVDWEYKDNKVVFRDFLTRQYQISALPAATSGTTTVGGSSSGKAGSTMSVSTASTIDVWSDVRTAIAGLVGQGGNISLSPSTGMVTVTARAADQQRVASYIQDLNGTVGQQISFDVNVLTVKLTGSANNGIDLNAVFNSNGVDGNSTASTDDGAVNVGIVSGNFSINAVVQALQKYGQVSVATRAGATTSNNKVTPVNVTDIKTYISGMEYSSTGGDNSTTVSSPEVEKIATGFQIQLLPRVMNNREIMVQYALILSELTGIETVTYQGGVQQLPQVSETAMEQQAVLKNGQTLVLAGFERDRTEVSDSGYDLRAAGVGGAVVREKNRVATVLLITPRLIDRQDLARR